MYIRTRRYLRDRLAALAFALTWQMMFILFLPFLFWEYDITVARRLIVVWGATYYIGQGLKDLYVPTNCLDPLTLLSQRGGGCLFA